MNHSKSTLLLLGREEILLDDLARTKRLQQTIAGEQKAVADRRKMLENQLKQVRNELKKRMQ